MTKISTIDEANRALQPYVPLVAQLTGRDTTLDRILPLMHLVGDPHERLKVVHIAGTSGKTSTAYYVAALLQGTGSKVGLTVSPHVDSITERVQLDGQPIADTKFCELLEEFLGYVEQLDQVPSYFELLYAFALWVFEREGVDYAVVETGMGGLHDATNIVTNSNKLCVITDIGFDHMHILGNTLPEIAAQKIGIAHKGNQVLTFSQAPEVMDVFEAWCVKQRAELVILNEAKVQSEISIDISGLPMFQRRNWLLAYAAVQTVINRDNLKHLTRQVLIESTAVQVPGRMDQRTVDGKIIIMDGAHNGQKMAAFVNSFKQRFPGVRPALLVSLKEGKEYQAVAPLLAELASSIIVTTFDTSQDLPARSINPAELATALNDAGAKNVIIEPDHAKAYQLLVQTPESMGVVTGSFYLLSQIRCESAY